MIPGGRNDTMTIDLTTCRALTFDLFGTVLDLGGSLTPYIAQYLEELGSDADPGEFWGQLRYRQRIEQYQDSLLMLGHSGYLETVQRAVIYVSRLNGLEPTPAEVETFMESWLELSPFPDCVNGLERLSTRFQLVALSNGNPWYLDHLIEHRIRFEFDDVISVETVGAFKPHPGVYRRAAAILDLEVGELLMVSSNSFDVMGARSCGLRGAYVDRYGLPYEDTPFLPDVVVSDFNELADLLLG